MAAGGGGSSGAGKETAGATTLSDLNNFQFQDGKRGSWKSTGAAIWQRGREEAPKGSRVCGGASVDTAQAAAEPGPGEEGQALPVRRRTPLGGAAAAGEVGAVGLGAWRPTVWQAGVAPRTPVGRVSAARDWGPTSPRPPHPRAPQQLPPPPFPGPLDPGRSLSNRLELPLPLYLALAFNKKSCCNWTPGGWSGGNCWLPAVGRAAVYLLGAGGRKGERAPGRPAGSSAAAAAAFQNPAQAETFGRVLLPSRTSLSSLLAQARRALFAPCLPSRRAPDVPSGFSSWGLGEIPLFSFCSHCHAGE